MNPTSETTLRQTMVEIGHRIYEKNFVAANDGNISVRLGNTRFLTTPTGVSKGFMQAEKMVVVDSEGNPISEGCATTEFPLHLFLYKERPDINAVVHAHPPYATGFATAGIPLDECILPEIVVTIGSIPLADYGTPSTEELPETLRPYVHSCDAFLLANHGVVVVGKNLMDACFKMERVEHYAKIVYIARALGGEKILPKGEVEKLFDRREFYGVDALNPGCYACHEDCIEDACVNHEVKHSTDGPDYFGEIVEKVLNAVR